MLEVFEQLASGNSRGGYPVSRIVCRMDWVGQCGSYVDEVVEFESRVNDVWTRNDDAVICTSHLGSLGDTILDIMRTHPMVIIGGILHQNPFFVPPHEFLRELQERRAARAAASSTAA